MKTLTGLIVAVITSAVGGGLLLAQRSPGDHQPPSRSAEVMTDQPDYLPGTTAGIVGDDFFPHETVQLQVLHADGTPSTGAEHQPWFVKADSHGEFVTSWHVCEDDCLGSELKLTAIGQRSGLSATALFSDGGQSSCQLQGWLNLSLQWGGTIQGNNSKYTENNTIPLRFTSTLTQGSQHTVLLKYDFSSGGTARFFDSLASYNASVANANVLAGVTSAGSPLQWPIPADASLVSGAQMAGVLTTYNIGSLSFGAYTLVNGVKVLPVTFTVASGSGSKNVVIAYGGHLASAGVWGANNGSSQFPGASTKAYANIDGGQDSNVSVNPGAIVPSADLSISKFAAPQPVFSGSNLTYTLVVANNGPDAAASVVVTDTLPGATALVSVSTSQGASSGANPLTFSLGTLNAKATATITIVTKVLLATDGTLTNSASVSSSTLDPNTANNTATVVSTVIDRNPPVINCPADIIASTSPGKCSAIASFAATATDDEGTVGLSYNPLPGSTFPIGTNLVVCTATDPDGNKASCSFNVIVLDTEPPVVNVPANMAVNNDPGLCSASVAFAANPTDNCGVSSTVYTIGTTPITSPFSFPSGPTTVTVTVTDIHNNPASSSFVVTVRDNQPPTITAPPDLTNVSTDPGQCTTAKANVPLGTPITADNCGVAGVVNNAPDVFPKGTTTVTWTVTDTSGYTATATQNVTVLDTEPPQIACLANIVTQADPGKCDAIVSFAVPAAVDNCDGSVAVVCNPLSGSVLPIGTNLVVCTATDAAGNTTNCVFLVVVQNPPNQTWPQALTLNLTDNLGIQQASVQQCLTALDQSRWFKFKVQPGSRVIVTLTDLPENYDLVLFSDIAAAYSQMSSQSDLEKLTAQFASEAFTPSAFSPSAFSPSAFSPSAFSPSAFSPSAFSPSAFSPSAFSPSAFSPSAFSPDAFAPSAFSPSAFSPSAFSPSAFSPSAFSPSAFSPSAFSAAQVQSVIGVSAFDGVASEGIVVSTWDNSGDFYVRVRGRNGVFSTGNAFQLNAYMLTGACGNVSPIALDASRNPLSPSTTAAAPNNYKTLILTDLNRWLGSDAAAKAAVSSKLTALAARPEVAGVIVDVGSDPSVAFFNTQADANYDCPYAKNLVAGAIQGIVNRSRVGNPLQYVVLIGDDSVIPFFRYPDEALLGPEQDYVPPVKDLSSSQASLRLNFVLGQDAYGAQCTFSHKTTSLPLADLAVGRLVQSPAQVTGMVDAYLGTSAGVVSTPTAALVTGYDFLADDAQAVQNEFAQGLGRSVDSLISLNNLAPSLCWTADNLRQALFAKRHDLIFLAGHFSASDALAADYSSHFLASELAASSIDFQNSILFSAGCHSGYNIVAGDSIPFVTIEPDWAQACAQKQATLVAGTGYQYGDTDFIEYSERLYLDFAKQLRTGSGPIPVGVALLNAKHDYLAATPAMRGIHAKTYLEAALFGLPMLSVDMPGLRLPASASTPVISALTALDTDPGKTLGLRYADLAVTQMLVPTTVVLNNTEDGTQTTATYLVGGDGLLNNPGEPILPLTVRNVAVNGTVMRGVGFRGGRYTDLSGKIPLTGAATTEIRGVHATFLSEVFYPMQPWNVNYFGSLCGGLDSSTRLMAIPGQFESDSPTTSTGTIRSFSEMDFRMFYSGNITTYTDQGNSSTPGLSAPPSISAVQGITSGLGDAVTLSARVVGNPAAGIQAVWVTYTAASGSWYGKWQSIELVQNSTDSTLWQASLGLSGISSHDVRYMVQAVNGVGLVALDTKLGAYHVPDEFDSATTAQLTPTAVNFLIATSGGAFSTEAAFSAQLTAVGGALLTGQRMVFSLGDQQIWATTGPDGVANASLPLRITPGSYIVTAAFGGSVGLAPSFATTPFSITRQTTALSIAPSLVHVHANVDTTIAATLTDGAGNRMVQRTVMFVVNGANGSYAIPRITDNSGSAGLGAVPLPEGSYAVTAYFNGTIPLPGNQSVTVDDKCYFPSTTSGRIDVTLVLDDTPPQIHCSTNIVQSTDLGRCDAVVNFITTATDNNPGVTLVCTPPSGSVFPKGTNLVSCVATDSAGNSSTCAFTVAVVDLEPPKVTCPNNVVVGNDPGKASAVVTFTVNATDNCQSVSVVCKPPSGAAFPLGTNLVICTATDSAGNQTTNTFKVTVKDTQPPVIKSLTASPNKLSTPNDQFVPITLTVVVTDNSGGSVTSKIIAVSSSEIDADAEYGTADWIITGPLTLKLEAEANKRGPGRTYTITVQCTDPSGNSATASTGVFVPAPK